MMERFDYDKNLFRLEEEEYVNFYLGALSWKPDSYEIRKRVICYNDKPLIFTFPGERDCRNGIRENRQYPYEYISVSFSSVEDSNFFILSDTILNEIKLIYPDILVRYLQKATIKIVLPSFVKFHKNYQVVEKPLLKTKFKINSMRIGFSQVRFKYCDNVLQNKELELLAYEIYLA